MAPPTWKAILPILVEMIARGTAECRAEAVSQLEQMAALADERNEMVRKALDESNLQSN